MKLIYTTTSPLARKCRIILRELGLTDRIEEIITATRSEDALIMTYNPNGMVPTLETDEGYTICETTVICNYLEKQSNNKKFIPQNGKEYWQIIGLDAIASQMLESVVSRGRDMKFKPKEFHFPAGIKYEQRRIQRGFDFLEKKSSIFINKVNRLHITLGMVCLVLDNVFPDEKWRENRSNILKVYEEFKSRDSFKDTATN